MYRLSLVIDEIYNKYLPEAVKAGVQFNLDFPDRTTKIKDPEKIKKVLDVHVGSAMKRTKKGEISIFVSKNKIEIRDSGTVLSGPAKALLDASDHVKVTSRVGFGTKVLISF